MKDSLVAAAEVFALKLPEWLEDETPVGKIAGIVIHAGEVRRLSKALLEKSQPSAEDEGLLYVLRTQGRINMIKLRRDRTGDGLKESKDYCDELGLRTGALYRDVNGIIRLTDVHIFGQDAKPYSDWEAAY